MTADRTTGRLTARFEDNPQLPAKHLTLVFKPGERAALVNPPTCTTATTTGVFTPWSRGGTRSDGVVVPGTPDATSSSSFDGQLGRQRWRLSGDAAVRPGRERRHSPTPRRGGSSPFTFDLTRGDRQDVINGVNVGLPGGPAGRGQERPAVLGRRRQRRRRVRRPHGSARPRSPPVRVTTRSTSPDQPVSLTGPYKGAPYGLAIAVHAVAGPFDLGTVVVRQALNVDPDDAHVTVVSDPLPTIRDGVPFRVRRVHVSSTGPASCARRRSCEAKTIATSVSSAGGQTANLSHADPVQRLCSKLPFAPKLR